MVKGSIGSEQELPLRQLPNTNGADAPPNHDGARLIRHVDMASRQSEVLDSREALESRFTIARQTYGERVPRPAWWRGYRIVPDEFEFWQGRPSRLHDRLRYSRVTDGWTRARLAPRQGRSFEISVAACYRRRHHDSVVLSFRIPGAAGKASRR
jgi:Pyridoxine 5'-phosphate oxidase C-terminal dimerisation region